MHHFLKSMVICIATSLMTPNAAAGQLSLSILITNLRSSTNLTNRSAELASQAGRDQFEAYQAERQDWKVDFEAERGLGVDPPQKYGGGLSRRITLGSDDGVRESLRNTAQAEHLEFLTRAREEEVALARDFVLLTKAVRLEETVKEFQTTLQRYLEFAQSQARLGAVSHLILRRWELLQRSLAADGEIATRQKRQMLGAFTARKLIAAPDPNTRSIDLEAVGKLLGPMPSYRPSLTAQAAELRRVAAGSQLASLERQREFELALGWMREINKGENSVKLGVSLPIDGGVIRASRAKDAQVSARTATLRAALESDADRRMYLGINARLTTATERIQVIEQQARDVESLFRDSIRGLERGQTELTEVIESLREWYEVRWRLIDALAEQEDSVVEVLSVTGTGPFALSPGKDK